MHFSQSTPLAVQNVLRDLLHTGIRIRVWIGDPVTGRAWPEEYDIAGTVSRSTGINKVPLLISRKGEFGGAAMLDKNILRIDRIDTNRTLYKHPAFASGATVEGCQVFVFGVLHANCATPEKAQRLAGFLNGDRYSK